VYGLLTIVVAAYLGRADRECNVFRTTYVWRAFSGAFGAGIGLGGIEDNFRVDEAVVLRGLLGIVCWSGKVFVE
jgi:hypothetical protein